MASFSGAFTALITPMTKTGEVDYEGFRYNVHNQIADGIDGLVPLGTTAETPTLDERAGGEEDRLIDIVMSEVKAAGRKVPVILGAGSNNTKDAITYTERAGKAGADAALVVTPYYNKPTQEGIFRHFEAVSRVGVPIVVYNIKGRTGVNIETDTLLRIAELPLVVGVKEASGSVQQMMDVVHRVKGLRPDFAVLSGDDALTLPLMALGGDGVVSVVSNLCVKPIADMVKAAKAGDYATARKIHYKMLPMFHAAFADGNPASIKCAMNIKGIPAGGVRLPLAEASERARSIIAEAVKGLGE